MSEKVICNMAKNSLCPLKEKCRHFKPHYFLCEGDCGEGECILNIENMQSIMVKCVPIKKQKPKPKN